MLIETRILGSEGLKRYDALRSDTAKAVVERFEIGHADVYARFGEPGRRAHREDIGELLTFLRPVLEFGLVEPLVDYLQWLASVLATRDAPAAHLPLALDWLADFFDTEMTPADAAIVSQALRSAQARFLETAGAPPYLPKAPVPCPEHEAFEGALLAADRSGAAALFDGCLDQGHGLVGVETRLIQPALYGIGRKWQNNQVSVAQEHLATAISQALMTRGLIQSELPPVNGKKVLLACIEGNIHSMGLQMVADAFQLAGWEVDFLGADMPTEDLVEHVRRSRPDLLGLSVAFPHQFRIVKECIAQLTRALGADRPPVIIGGLAINQFSRLAQQLGAEACVADAVTAVASASSFVQPLSTA